MARTQIPNYIARKSKWTAVFKTGGVVFWPMFLVLVVLIVLHLNDVTHLGMGHTLYKVSATEATETEAGNAQYYICCECDKMYSDAKLTKKITKDDVVIAPTGTATTNAKADSKCGHTLYHGVAVKDTLDGYKDIYFCLDCDGSGMYAASNGTKNIDRPGTMTLFGMTFFTWTLVLGVYALICLITLICAFICIRFQYVEFYDSYVIQKRGVFYKQSRKTIFPQASRVSVRKHLFNYGDVEIDVVGPWDVDLTGIARPEDVREYLIDHMISPSSVDGLSSNPYIAALGVSADTIF